MWPLAAFLPVACVLVPWQQMSKGPASGPYVVVVPLARQHMSASVAASRHTVEVLAARESMVQALAGRQNMPEGPGVSDVGRKSRPHVLQLLG
jgi:hypothetical protein